MANWKHRVPKNQESKHKTAWPQDGKSDCTCNPEVDEANRIVKHKPTR